MARIAFIQNLVYEYLGTMYLSSLLKKNRHCVEVFIQNSSDIKNLINGIDEYRPDIIGFYCTTGIYPWVLYTASFLKNKFPKIKIILGGPHPTFFPEIIKESSVDIICRGEAELALLELLERIDKDRDYTDIENLWIKKDGKIFANDVRPLLENLDSLPFPDRDLYIKRYPFLNKSQKVFMAGRGCPFSCSFCFNARFRDLYKGKGCYVRLRSVENLISEIEYVKDNYKLNTVYIQDDTFILNKKWTLEFLKEYKKKIDLPFICLIRADYLMRRSLVF